MTQSNEIMKRSIPFVLRIILIYIIVKLFNCSVNANTVYIETALNRSLPTIGLFNDISIKRQYLDYDEVPSQRIDGKSTIENQLENLQDENNQLIDTEVARDKRNTERDDICNIAECACKTDTRFLTVDCQFQQVSTLSR